MKKAFTLLLAIACIFTLAGCNEKGQSYFNAEVQEVNEGNLLVEITDNFNSGITIGEQAYVSTDVVAATGCPELAEGENIRVVFNGEVMETAPVKLGTVFAIYELDEQGEVIPNVPEASEEVSEGEAEDGQWGITLSTKDVKPTGLILVCTQSGGAPTGELNTGSPYFLEKLEDGQWVKVEYVPQMHEVAWTGEAWMIPLNASVEWEVDWEWLYGALPAGNYRIGKTFMDFRKAGDYDTQAYYAEFEIVE